MASTDGKMRAVAGSSSASELEDFHVALVPLGLVTQVWPRVEPLLRTGFMRGTPLYATVEQTLHELTQGRALLWIGGYGSEVQIVMLGTIIQYPAARALRLNFIAGRGMREAWPSWPQVEAFGRAQGCTHVEAIVRPGLARLFRRVGMHELGVYVGKPLVHYAA